MKSKIKKSNLLFTLLCSLFMVTVFTLSPPTLSQAKEPKAKPGFSIIQPTDKEVKEAPDEAAEPAPSDTVETPPPSTDEPPVTPPADGPDSKNLFAIVWHWILQNKEASVGLLLLVLDALVRLTPTEKDNNLLRLLQSWLDKLVPNRKKGGGQFAAFHEPDDAPALAAVVPK